MKNFTKLLFAALLSLSTIYVEAQKGDTLEIQRNTNGAVLFARFKSDPKRSMQNAVGFLKTVLHAGPRDELRLTKETTDRLGFTHLKYHQYYKGLKVENAEYIVHGKNDIIEIINGDFQQIDISTVTPSLTEQQALDKALAYVNAKKYKWQDTPMERFIKRNTGNPQATYYPQGEVVIATDGLKGGNNWRLAWKFTISSLVPNNEQWVYVDAITGEVIGKTPLILDTNASCTAETMFSGTLGITGDSFTGGFRLRENRNGVSIQTLNLHGTSNYASATDFTNTNTSWTTGSWTNIAQDQQALDAHWGSEVVLDYWRTVQLRNSLNDAGIRILSYVHTGSGWNNAQWVGGSGNHFMQYGDGDGTIFSSFTALDVCAHEMGHGIAEFTSNFHSTSGMEECDALNEGFSDIWGACIEHWAAPAKQTWLIGEEIFATSAFTCLRNLQNPKSTTAAEGQHPDTYGEDFWDSGGEPHHNSTVLSHWFYLLSQGDDGVNDLENSYSVTGIAINKAQRIAYRAESVYLNSSATYADARNATIQAARDLYGTNSCEEIAATNAWYAVGVGNPYNSAFVSSVEYGPDCDAIKVIAAAPPTATLTWVTPPGVLINGNPSPQTITGNSATITSTNGNYTNITVADGVCHSGTTDFCPCVDWPGNPQITWVWSSPAQGEPLEAYVSPAHPSADRYIWMVDGQVIQDGPETELQAYDYPCTSEKDLIVIAVDGCGATAPVSGGPYSPLCAAYRGTHDVVAYPNPASSQLTVKLKEPYVIKGKSILQTNILSQIHSITIYDNVGRERKTLRFNKGSKQVSFDVDDLPNQVYYLKVSDGQHAETISVLISR